MEKQKLNRNGNGNGNGKCNGRCRTKGWLQSKCLVENNKVTYLVTGSLASEIDRMAGFFFLPLTELEVVLRQRGFSHWFSVIFNVCVYAVRKCIVVHWTSICSQSHYVYNSSSHDRRTRVNGILALSIWIFWFEYCPLHYTPFGGFHSTMCTFFSACTSKRGCYGDTTCAIFASLHNLNNNLGNRMRVSLLDICWVWMAIYVDIQLFCIEAHAYFLWRQFWYPYMEAGIHIRMEATIHWLQLQTNIPLTLTIKCELQKT